MSNIKCEVRPSDFQQFVKLLYQADPEKYKNFDSVAHFILGNPLLDPEKKVLAVFNSAIIYSQMDDLNTVFTPGNAYQILGLKAFLNNHDQFLSEANQIYGLNESQDLDQSAVNKAIAALGVKEKLVSLSDLNSADGLFKIVDMFLRTHEFPNKEARAEAIDKIFESIHKRIDSLGTGNKKDVLHDEVTRFQKRFVASNSFFPIREIAREAGIDNFLIRMKDGTVHEGVEANGQLMILNNDGSLNPVTEDQIESSEKAISTEMGRTSHNSFQHVFFQDTIDSGLKIITRRDDSRGETSRQVIAALGKVTDPASELEVKLIPVSDVSNNRVARIQGLAESNPSKYSSLTHRNHETFENQEQEKFLAQNPDGKVLTLSRPKQGSFIIQVSFKNRPEIAPFNLYAFDNYAFLNANNKTETVDFTNPAHLKEVQRLSVNRENGNKTLTDQEIEKMAAAQRSYNAFLEKVKSAPEQDVSNLFFEHYQIEKAGVVTHKMVDFNEDPESQTMLFPVKVVKSLQGEPDMSTVEDRNIVIYFSKIKGETTFRLNQTIGEDEMIYIPELDRAVGLQRFVEERMGINQETLKSLFRSKKGLNDATNILIKQKPDGSFDFRRTSPKNTMETLSFFGEYIVGLNILSQMKNGRAVESFEKSEFTFKLYSPSSLKHGRLLLSLSTTKEGKLQIELRPREAYFKNSKGEVIENKYFEIIDNSQMKQLFNLPVNMTLVNTFQNALMKSQLIAKIVKAYPALAKLKMNTPKDVRTLFEFIEDEIKNERASSEMIELSEKVEKMMSAFAESMVNDINKMFDKLQVSAPELHAMLVEDYTTESGEFRPDYLVADPKGELMVPKIRPHEKNESGKQKYFMDPSNFEVLQTSKAGRGGVKFKSKVTVAPDPVREMKIVTPPVSNPQIVVQVEADPEPVVPVQEAEVKREIDTDPMWDSENFFFDPGTDQVFELAESGEVVTETAMEREAALEWIQKTYPDFNIEQGDISELLDLTSIDGRVLGAFRNKVIYLDNQLLGKGTAYHEAFHGVFRHLFTEQDRTTFRNNVISDPKNAKFFTTEAMEDFAAKRNMLFHEDKIRDLIAEEILAEGFQRYMNSGRKPTKGFLAKIFEAIKNLIKLFRKRGAHLEQMYERVASGQYASRVIESGMFENQTVYELIPGLARASMENGRIKISKDVLGIAEGKQVVNRIASLVVADLSNRNFDEKFDEAVKTVVTKFYNLEKLVASAPVDKQDKVREKFGRLYANVQFALGGRAMGLDVYDINDTGNSKFDKTIFPTKNKLVDQGDQSKNIIKKQVKESVGKLARLFETVDMSKEEIESEPESAPAGQLDMFDEGIQNGKVPDGDEADSDEAGENFNEKSMMEFNRMDSLNKEIRRFISAIEVDVVHPGLGVTTTRMIDPTNLFSVLLKISANVSADKLISNIVERAIVIENDGYAEEAAELFAFHKKVNELLVLNNKKEPSENVRLYHMLIDVLYGTEMDYVMLKLNTKASEEEGVSTGSFTMRDRVFTEDQRVRKRELVGSIASTHSLRMKSPSTRTQYIDSVNRLLELSKMIAASNKTNFILDSLSESRDKKLLKMTEELHGLFEKIGMNLPKSLLEMSVMAIEIKSNQVSFEKHPDLKKKLDVFEPFIREGQYLEKDFFTAIQPILELALSPNNNVLQSYLDDSRQKSDKTLSTFNSVLEKASAYILTMNPTKLPSVVKNAERKAIYRYTKYTPIQSMIRDMKEKGLYGMMETDPYFEEYLEAFIKDNPYLADPENPTTQAFLKNMRMAMFGGVQQTINAEYNEGKSFKDLDSKTLYISFILGFMSRDVHTYQTFEEVDGVKKIKVNELQTFMRPFSQLEASQSNYLVTGRYFKLADSNGATRDKSGNMQMSNILKRVIRQEYNRMQRVYESRDRMADEYNSGRANNLILGFNATLNPDGTANVHEVEDLRAYQFNKFQDLFKDKSNARAVALEQKLRQLAVSGIKFEELDAETEKELMSILNEYVDKRLEKHIERLIELNVLTYGNHVSPTGEEANIPKLISDFIPSKMRIGNSSSKEWTNEYGFSNDGSYKLGDQVLAANSPNIKALITDAYLNFWANGVVFNDIFDGDMGMSVKDPLSYIKRNKKHLAAGSNMKAGYHRVSYVDTIYAYVSDKYPGYGEFYSAQEIGLASWIKPEHKSEMVRGFRAGEDMQKVFDGQSVSSIMHQIDQFESLGRLDDKVLDILMAKHYRELTTKELKYLKGMGVVMNSKKTVTAGRFSYHKLSEVHIDRNDASVTIVPQGMTLEQVHKELHKIYQDIYALRKREQAHRWNGEVGLADMLDKDIKDMYAQTHAYFEPMPHRARLHHLLNSMEIENIDQMMDTEASKNATLLPVSITRNDGNGYQNMGLSSIQVENQYKYSQVETSGVKERATFSVQSKALLPADIRLLGKLMKKEGIDVNTDPKAKAALDQTMMILEEYQDSLRQAAQVAFENFKNFTKTDGAFDVKTIFKLIRESLAEQNAPMNKLKLFDMDPKTGEPVFDPNYPMIRHMLEYYFFSQYSKITDEKGAGFKNIHVSSYGYQILVNNDTNEVVTTDQYRKNPELYPNVSSRPLKVDTEVTQDADGNETRTYWVEVIMPKPKFKSLAEERFWKKNLSKMFGTRIPTEDKRSMIAMKVVDFIDSSNATGLIVPNIVHLLSGSDLDVDAVYGHMKAHYESVTGKQYLFGDRTSQKSDFFEWVHSATNSKDIKKAVKEKLAQVKAAAAESLERTDLDRFRFSKDTMEFLELDGVTKEDMKYFPKLSLIANELKDPRVIELFDEIKEISEQISEAMAEREKYREDANRFFQLSKAIRALRSGTEYLSEEQQQEALAEVEKLEQEREPLREASDSMRMASGIVQDLINQRNQLNEGSGVEDLTLTELRRVYKKSKNLLRAALRAEAMLLTLADRKLPTTAKAFLTSGIPSQTIEASQNRNLDAKLALLSNELVYDFLYSKERSSVEEFENILKTFGIKVGEIGTDVNIFTMDAVIAAKITTQMNKDGIGITANLNKTLALASQYGLELKDGQVIWNYRNRAGDAFRLFEFGGLTDDNVRTINLIGNILGMFADGAKKPIPAALKMNEVNAGTSLSMIGMGMTPAMAMAFNFIPEIQRAVEVVSADKSAVGSSISASVKQFAQALQDELDEMIRLDGQESKEAGKQSAMAALATLGMIDKNAYARNLKVDTKNLMLDYQAQNMGHESIFRTDMSLPEIGFNLAYQKPDSDTTVDLSPNAQKILLMGMYIQQVKQTNEVKKAGSLINMFKKLNPNFISFDSMMANIESFRNTETNIFKEEGVNRVFEENQVWPVLIEVMDDLQKEGSKLFLERGGFFSFLTRMFSTVVTDSSIVAKTVTSFVSLQLFKQKYIGSRITSDMTPEQIQMINEEDEMFSEVMDPKFWFTNNLGEELEEMKEMYPDNLFLAMLSEHREEVMDKTKGIPLKDVPSIRYLVGRTRLSVSPDEVTSDYEKLLYYSGRKERLFARKLFFHELVRTGLNHTPNSFMPFVSVEQLKPVVDQMKNFVSLINNKKDSMSLMEAFEQVLDTQDDRKKLVFFNDLFVQMARFTVKDAEKVKIQKPSSMKFSATKDSLNKFITTLKDFDYFEGKDATAIAKAADEARTDLIRMAEVVFEKELDENLTSLDMFFMNEKRQFVPNRQLVDASETLVMNFDNALENSEMPASITEKTLEKLASTFRINKIGANEYEFPVMIKTSRGYLLLVGVDEQSENDFVGESLIQAVQEDKPMKHVGARAKYKMITELPTPNGLSPLAFNSKDNQLFTKIVGGKVFLEATEEVLDITREELLEDYSQNPTQEEEEFDGPDMTSLLTGGDMFGAVEETEDSSEEDLFAGPDLTADIMALAAENKNTETDDADGAENLQQQQDLMKLLGMIPDATEAAATLMSSEMQPLQIFADGSDIKGTGQMGFGAAFQFAGKWHRMSGTESSPAFTMLQSKFPNLKFSNNTMEMMAILAVVSKFSNTGEHVQILTDNKNAINWGPMWKYSEGSEQRHETKPFKMNEPYIEFLANAIDKRISQITANGGSVSLRWVKGHNGTTGNEIADETAKNREIFDEFDPTITQAQQILKKLNEYSLDKDVLETLYEMSSKRKSFGDFVPQAQALMASMKGVMPTGEIIEKIKCI